MKAKIKTPHHENKGQTFKVVEILHNKIVCLYINGRKVDFGTSEVEFVADASLGREIIFSFGGYYDSTLRYSHLYRIAKRAAAAWNQKVSTCVSAAHAYVSCE